MRPRRDNNDATFWPTGAGQWFQAALLLAIFAAMIAPVLFHYWTGIQRLGGFMHCLRLYLGR